MCCAGWARRDGSCCLYTRQKSQGPGERAGRVVGTGSSLNVKMLNVLTVYNPTKMNICNWPENDEDLLLLEHIDATDETMIMTVLVQS